MAPVALRPQLSDLAHLDCNRDPLLACCSPRADWILAVGSWALAGTRSRSRLSSARDAVLCLCACSLTPRAVRLSTLRQCSPACCALSRRVDVEARAAMTIPCPSSNAPALVPFLSHSLPAHPQSVHSPPPSFPRPDPDPHSQLPASRLAMSHPTSTPTPVLPPSHPAPFRPKTYSIVPGCEPPSPPSARPTRS